MPARWPSFRTSVITLLFALGIAACSSGCVTMTDLETSQENSREVVAQLTQPAASIEQTFIMRRSGLNSLTVWAGKSSDSQAAKDKTNLPLQIDLFRYPQEKDPIFSRQVSVSSNGPLFVNLSVQKDPPGQAYLIRLSAPQGGLDILGVKTDIYAKGTALLDNQPISADIAFRTTYDYGLQTALGDALHTLPDFWLILPLAAVFLLPGWLILELFGLADRFDGGEQLALSVGISLSAIPILMLWTTTLGLHWSRGSVILAAFVLLALAVWRVWNKWTSVHITPIGLALAGIFLLSLGVRLAMARDLAGPAWVDSVHHALITRLIQINGGFPPTYAPYLDMPANQYHSGYHSAMAVFQWLSGLPLQDAMLLFGNVMNALAALAVYLFTTTLTRSRPAGLVAALVTGLVTPMPAYYTSWGRYTELAGLLVLPAALAFAVMILEAEDQKPGYKVLFLACLTFSGMLLVHYRVFAFLAVLLAAYILGQVSLSKAKMRSLAEKTLWLGAALVLGCFLLALPWIIPNITRTVAFANQGASSPPSKWFGDFTPSFLLAALGKPSLWSAGLGLAAMLIRRRRLTLTLALWILGMFVLANLGVYNLPGRSFINNTSVEISLFIPISLCTGYLVSQIGELAHKFVPPRFSRLTIAAFTAAGLVAAVLGAQQLLPLLNPATELFRQGDLPAMAWIQTNIAQNETILINPFQWTTIVYAGSDGGYWITPLTGRKTLPPPALYGFGSNQDLRKIDELCLQVSQSGSSPVKLWDLMQANDIHFVYSGVRGGPILVSGLAASPHFQMVYADQGAYIFKTIP